MKQGHSAGRVEEDVHSQVPVYGALKGRWSLKVLAQPGPQGEMTPV